MDEDTRRALARDLDAAEHGATQVEQFSLRHPDMTFEDAYAIQRHWIAIKTSRGRRVRGHKIGLTSRAMQQAVGIDEPDYGVLTDDMFWADGVQIDTGRLIEPRVEAELAFVLRHDLHGPDCTLQDVLDATAYVQPALEILDARIRRVDRETGRSRTVLDTISDNAANCAIICGGRMVRPTDVDLRRVSVLVYRDAQIEETGVAAGVLNHPGIGVAWLANRLHPWGESLKAGEVILSGSFIRPIAAAAGRTFHADFGEMGSVACRFA
ncbi:2-oxo-hept-4-ene-1,7-dioate hydratase [Jiella sonneratiae]|uniref:2-oxo-hepta-3-ene-1,7-dioic acid hydratase n=1 Tax=Jiella sonneratiae TaxID=2816856 RepID=A0ABS3J269_9HYPH|nr:2-oxo-hepta-3-ene-1,7-dioic acid hydratase [Jiella sonneratiae]MBO0903759.1 2-oxo-hepta-3-ene-1,7-dioic acid hydratase [Jiella sonneratiae]